MSNKNQRCMDCYMICNDMDFKCPNCGSILNFKSYVKSIWKTWLFVFIVIFLLVRLAILMVTGL